MSDFFEYYRNYKKQKAIQEELAIMEDYFDNSDDFKMDCAPIPLSKKKIYGKME